MPTVEEEKSNPEVVNSVLLVFVDNYIVHLHIHSNKCQYPDNRPPSNIA